LIENFSNTEKLNHLIAMTRRDDENDVVQLKVLYNNPPIFYSLHQKQIKKSLLK